MGDVRSIIEFSIAIIVMIAAVFIIYYMVEKKKKKSVRNNFRSFTNGYKVPRQNLRAVPRVVVPESLEVTLTLTDSDVYGLKAYVMDMSLSGISARPLFPLKRLPVNSYIYNVLVVTPINSFAIKEMRTVRIDYQVDKRIIAFHIEKIDEDQFAILKQFMTYLDEFLKRKKDVVEPL